MPAILIAGLGVSGLWRWWTIRDFHLAMAEVNTQMAAGRRAGAAKRLTSLLHASPDPDRVAYLLGVCERTRGRADAADAAWALVTPGSDMSPRAIEARMALRVDAGQWAAAEIVINNAAAIPHNDGTALQILLVPIYFDEGRLDDALDLVDARLNHLQRIGEGASHTAIVLARLHFDLEQTTDPAETVRAKLERAGQMAPDDDRVWLGRANLAVRTGHLDEAARWLDACERRRPQDIPVWKARTRWAMAASQVDTVKKALHHRPANALTEPELHAIRAWLARHNEGDRGVEREELALVVAARPADRLALDRLSEIARAAGQTEDLARWQGRKAEMERMTDRYKKLVARKQPIRDSSELALLAEKLGRPLEARVYLGVATAEGFGRRGVSRPFITRAADQGDQVREEQRPKTVNDRPAAGTSGSLPTPTQP